MSGGTGSGRSRQYKLSKIRRLVARDGPNCRRCSRELQVDPVPEHSNGIIPDDYPTIDHIVARVFGGSWEMENLQLLCLPCHRSKSAWERKRITKGDYLNAKKVKIKQIVPEKPERAVRSVPTEVSKGTRTHPAFVPAVHEWWNPRVEDNSGVRRKMASKRRVRLRPDGDS